MSTIPINTDDSPGFVSELIYQLKIKDAMSSTLVTAGRSDTLRHVQQLMKERKITGVPIVDGTRLLGIVSVDDIIRALEDGRMDDRVDSVMSRQLIVLEDDMPLAFGVSYMDKYRFGRFPVLNKDKELVGIITSRDILIALLVEFNKEAEAREQEIEGSPGDAQIRREYSVRKFDFENAGKPTSEFKKELKTLGLPPKLLRRIAVASYELEMNQVVHSEGGTIAMKLTPGQVEILAVDKGPGIADVNQALEQGYSTATEWVRSLGFGAGMGLPNARRAADDFEISSGTHGTTVRCRFDVETPDENESNEEKR